MAPSAKHFALLFLLALLSFKLTQARQSQFFSKVATTTTTVNTPSTNAKDTVQVLDDQPNFVQDSRNGYGLYDHSTGQLPPDSDTSKTPTSTAERLMDQRFPTTTYNDDSNNNNNNEYMNEQQGLSGMSLVDMDPNSPTGYNNQAYVAKPDEYKASNNNYYKYANEQQGFNGVNYNNNQVYATKPDEYRDFTNKNNYNKYVNEPQGFSGTSLMNRGSNNQAYTSNAYGYESTNNNNNYMNYNNNGFNTYNSQQNQGEVFGEEKYLGEYNNNKNTNYYNNGRQQGMSDTRFMENGKYYYDVKNEYNYNPNVYSKSNINGNSMEGYQNQESENGFNP